LKAGGVLSVYFVSGVPGSAQANEVGKAPNADSLALKTSYVTAAVPPAFAGGIQLNVAFGSAESKVWIAGPGIDHTVLFASLQSQGTAWRSPSASVLFGLFTPGQRSRSSGIRSPS